MGEIEQVTLVQDGRGWGVELRLHTGCVRRYGYASEAQARFFAAVFAMGPRVLPPARAVRRPRRRAAAASAPRRAAGR
jgi:hypothetical protein